MAKNIGIVEDEGIVALDLSGILIKMGYKTAFLADSAEKAMEGINECAPDLILMDVALKGAINGLQLAAKIKETYNIPIIFLSAFEDENIISKINKVSEFGYLVKPFDDEDLKSAIKKAIG